MYPKRRKAKESFEKKIKERIMRRLNKENNSKKRHDPLFSLREKLKEVALFRYCRHYLGVVKPRA